jgi:16S rRNA (cytosine967-C5)-methyltransferase
MARAASKISPARAAAFEILLAVERRSGHSDDLLRARSVSRLSAQDRNLATALVLGVLRWQIALDARIRPLLTRPNAKLDAEVLIALRMGAFQLLHLDRIPAHAAIDESVELARAAGHRFASGMVNAVLRKVAVAGGAVAEPRQAYPAWMVERWERFFGAEMAEAICRYGVSEPELSIRLEGAEAVAELADAGVRFVPGQLLTAARTVIAGDVMETAAFREGRARIQDEGSQLVAEIAGEGAEILDACAAPGGKTLILAERNPRARMVACEVNPQRLAALRKRLSFLGERVECRQADAAELAESGVFDLVLVDAPCSGTGTLGRNPEIRHRLQADEFARQAERQRAILRSALRAARPGARVVYSTCSLEPEENEQVIEAVLADRGNVRVAPLQGRIAQMREEGIVTEEGAARLLQCVTAEGYLRIFFGKNGFGKTGPGKAGSEKAGPGAPGTDGFFVALMENRA